MIPLYTLSIGVSASVAYVVFLVCMARVEKKDKFNVLDTNTVSDRPGFWWMPFLEWMVVTLTLVWFLVICAIQ